MLHTSLLFEVASCHCYDSFTIINEIVELAGRTTKFPNKEYILNNGQKAVPVIRRVDYPLKFIKNSIVG